MNAIVWLKDENITDIVRLDETRISYDSSRRITTAQITIMSRRPGTEARYDLAFYDEDYYTVDVSELFLCRIIDGRDGVTKLFEGHIFALDLKQTDGESPETLYVCELNDYASWLDRAVAWTDPAFTLTFPCSDKTIVQSIIGHFCPQVKALLHVEQVLPAIQNYEWQGKTCRQILEEVCALSLAQWRVDFDAELWYGPAMNAPTAPYKLSTSPDYVETFPVRVDNWKRNFTNPINRAFVRGAISPVTGVPAQAEYSDPVSVAEYGELSYSIVDDSVTDPLDAELRAKTTVLRYAYPVEQGSFTIWQDDLKIGQRVHIHEDALGIDGWYVINSLSMHWTDKWQVEYQANFGAAQPDLESYLRLLDQRTRWKSAKPAASVPIAGSVTDDSIADEGLHEESISSVNGGVIGIGTIDNSKISSISGDKVLVGTIDHTRIGSVNGQSVLIGSIDYTKIDSVNGGTIVAGSIDYSKIGSVNAGSITVGVIIGDQLADKIIDDLAKYTDALRPVRIVASGDPWPPSMPNPDFPANSHFYYEPNGHFYKVTADGLTWTDQGTNPDSLSGQMKFYQIGKLSAQNINGLILAAQIDNITAGQITGTIQGSKIGNIIASTITVGKLQGTQIENITGTSIQAGAITADKITSVAANTITVGKLQGSQIQNIDATTITIGTMDGSHVNNINGGTINIGTVGDAQIGNGISGGKLNVGSINSDKLNSTEISVGGGGGKPGKFGVYNGSGVLIGSIGNLDGANYGGWFKVFGAGGTGYADAKVYTDTSGNMFIRNVDLTITSAQGTIVASPSTYDQSYTTQCIRITKDTDKAEFISRGLVCYSGSSQVASCNRSPHVANAGEVTVSLSGTNNVILDGRDGTVWANGGFKAGPSKLNGQSGTMSAPGGASATFTNGICTAMASGSAGTTGTMYAATGAYVSFSGGICTAIGAATRTGLTMQVNVAKPGSGYYELYFNGGLLTGVNSF